MEPKTFALTVGVVHRIPHQNENRSQEAKQSPDWQLCSRERDCFQHVRDCSDSNLNEFALSTDKPNVNIMYFYANDVIFICNHVGKGHILKDYSPETVHLAVL